MSNLSATLKASVSIKDAGWLCPNLGSVPYYLCNLGQITQLFCVLVSLSEKELIVESVNLLVL